MLARSHRVLALSKWIDNAATVFLLLGGGMLVFFSIENLARMAASAETLIITGMFGGAWLAWLALRARRTQPEPKWRIVEARHPGVVRASQAVSLLLPLLLLAVITANLASSPTGGAGASTAMPNPVLIVIASTCIGIAYALRWALEFRSHE